MSVHGNGTGLRTGMKEESTRVDNSNALSSADGLYRLLVESVRDYAIFMLDPDGRVASWNDGARRIKGYTPEEIVGRHFSTFYPAADIASGKPAWELAAATRDGKYEEEG